MNTNVLTYLGNVSTGWLVCLAFESPTIWHIVLASMCLISDILFWETDND